MKIFKQIEDLINDFNVLKNMVVDNVNSIRDIKVDLRQMSCGHNVEYRSISKEEEYDYDRKEIVCRYVEKCDLCGIIIGSYKNIDKWEKKHNDELSLAYAKKAEYYLNLSKDLKCEHNT